MASDLSPFSALKKPYQAALNGDWEAMKSFYDKHPEHVVRPLTIDGLTPLHIAGYSSEGTELLQHLLSLLPPSEIPLAISKKSDHHNNVFHEVASTNNVASAKLLISELSQNNLPKLKMILEDRNQIGETPLFRAAALGKDKTLGTKKEINGMTGLHLLAKMPSAFRSSCDMGKVKRLLYHFQQTSSQTEDLERGGQDTSSPRQSNKHPPAISRKYYDMWRGLAKEWPAIDEIWKAKRKHESAIELTKLLVKMDTTWTDSLKVEDRPISLGKGILDALDDESNSTEGGADKGGRGDQTPDTPLLIAASEGIVEIFDEILYVNPQAIEHINKDEVTIVVAAIRHRRREIFRRLKMMKGVMEHRLFSLIDKRGYTILHHAADMKNYNGGTRAGPALQLQEELQWFERVRKIVPSHYVMHRNNAGKTADELFKEQHAGLLNKAERWIKETSQSCSAIAILVATVVFTAALTVPGGNDKTGHPIFLHSPFFLFFIIMDVISLASSLTYVVMFLSILTSPFKQENFLEALPRKLMIGFTLLFLSITTTMLSFAATIFLINHFDKKAMTITLINIAVLLPVSIFALMQFPLYVALSRKMNSLFKKIMKKALQQTSISHFFHGR
ncbi:hypothetical protein FH972_000156 [Carpinus fangiana]|uniref:PGG domain-containing protein n=1 Tax=Carpinus fangiana TaxID=176857 RepID=A0A5N6Q7X0_9ROSI|nr:hypothetical protein FH972_000156 [Carpinus fangiana]